MDAGHLVAFGALALVLSLGSFTELTSQRIPNALTLSAAGLGLLLGYLPGGISLASSVGGLAIGFGVLFVFYLFGGMGGGDVKLMGAVGALVGCHLILPIVMYTAIVGGLMSLFTLIWHGELKNGLGRSLRLMGRESEPMPDRDAKPLRTMSIPYGLAIAAGCLMALLLAPGNATVGAP